MDNKKLMNILLNAQKNEKIKGGSLTCGAALSSGKTELLVVAKDATPGTKTKFGQLAFKYDVEIITAGFSREFAWAIGKKNVEVVAIIDKEIADEIRIIFAEI